MFSIMLKSKLHNATVTGVELEYEGSLAIDSDLMQRVKLLPYEKIMVANLANGERFETYAIPAPPGSGTFCLNGATAHLGSVGDRLIVFAFGVVAPEELASHRPLILVLGKENKPTQGLRDT
jgi:aspartate 1-decarboxylase